MAADGEHSDVSDYSGDEGGDMQRQPNPEVAAEPAEGGTHATDSTASSTYKLRMMLLPDGVKPGGLMVFSLPCPRTGAPRKFACWEDGAELYELRRHTRPTASWLIAGEVVSDGTLWALTPIDPLFVVLRLLHPVVADGGAARLSSIDDFFAAAGDRAGVTPAGIRELRRLSEPTLRAACEVQDVDGDQYIRRSDRRAAAWLRAKAARLRRGALLQEWWRRDVAAARGIEGGGAAVEAPPEREMALQALHLLHEYTPPALFPQLCEAEGFEPKEFEREQGRQHKDYVKGLAERDADLKRQREVEAEAAAKKRMASASMSVRRLAKDGERLAKGTKSIASFFGKKPAAPAAGKKK